MLIPVADVDRARDFYVENCGFNLDVDHQPNEQFRVVQITPPGSACSLTFGIGITDAATGSYRGTHLVVTDIDAARAELAGRSVDVSQIRHMGPNGWEPGPDPEHRDYGSFADFSDPDGNTWVLQDAVRAASDEGERATLIATDRRALFTAEVAEGTPVRPGERIGLAIDPSRLRFFDPETGSSLRSDAVASAA